MGTNDQFAKRVFAQETQRLTEGKFSWEAPTEVGLHGILPDGLLHVSTELSSKELVPPWSLARDREIIIELKMAGDHLDRMAYERALLRRQAWQVKRCEKLGKDWRERIALWIVAPHVPLWIRSFCTITEQHPGCYQIERPDADIYWIAANQLPLKAELVPFLVARSRNHLLKLVEWAFELKQFNWADAFLEELPLSGTQIEQLLKRYDRATDEEQLQRRAQILKRWLELNPEIQDELSQSAYQEDLRFKERAQGHAEVLQRLFEQRLKRSLEASERDTLKQRLQRWGYDKLTEIVMEYDAKALTAWLHEKHD